MKRNMELIRWILEYIEEHYKMFRPDIIDESTFTAPAEQVKYHLRLILDAGYIKSVGINQGFTCVEELTWAGHNALDELRAKG